MRVCDRNQNWPQYALAKEAFWAVTGPSYALAGIGDNVLFIASLDGLNTTISELCM